MSVVGLRLTQLSSQLLTRFKRWRVNCVPWICINVETCRSLCCDSLYLYNSLGPLCQHKMCVVVQIIHAAQRKHQSSPSLGFVKGIHRCPVNSPHKGPVTRKLFPSEDVIIILFHLSLVVSVDYSCRCIGIRLSVLVRCNILNNVTHALTDLITKSITEYKWRPLIFNVKTALSATNT